MLELATKFKYIKNTKAFIKQVNQDKLINEIDTLIQGFLNSGVQVVLYKEFPKYLEELNKFKWNVYYLKPIAVAILYRVIEDNRYILALHDKTFLKLTIQKCCLTFQMKPHEVKKFLRLRKMQSKQKINLRQEVELYLETFIQIYKIDTSYLSPCMRYFDQAENLIAGERINTIGYTLLNKVYIDQGIDPKTISFLQKHNF